jgi:hypothetical protein
MCRDENGVAITHIPGIGLVRQMPTGCGGRRFGSDALDESGDRVATPDRGALGRTFVVNGVTLRSTYAG